MHLESQGKHSKNDLWPESYKVQGQFLNLELVSQKLNHFFHFVHGFSTEVKKNRPILQVNLCQKLSLLHQLTHNMTTDFSLNYKFNTWNFQAQAWGEHVVYRICFWHSEQFLYPTCSPHVLQKEELLTKIYLHDVRNLCENKTLTKLEMLCGKSLGLISK